MPQSDPPKERPESASDKDCLSTSQNSFRKKPIEYAEMVGLYIVEVKRKEGERVKKPV